MMERVNTSVGESQAHTLIRRGEGVLWRTGHDRVMVRPIGRNTLDLGGAATAIWLALDQPTTVEHLRLTFESLTGGQLLADFDRALDQLLADRLIERVDG
jgi:hypothetical protein